MFPGRMLCPMCEERVPNECQEDGTNDEAFASPSPATTFSSRTCKLVDLAISWKLFLHFHCRTSMQPESSAVEIRSLSTWKSRKASVLTLHAEGDTRISKLLIHHHPHVDNTLNHRAVRAATGSLTPISPCRRLSPCQIESKKTLGTMSQEFWHPRDTVHCRSRRPFLGGFNGSRYSSYQLPASVPRQDDHCGEKIVRPRSPPHADPTLHLAASQRTVERACTTPK